MRFVQLEDLGGEATYSEETISNHPDMSQMVEEGHICEFESENGIDESFARETPPVDVCSFQFQSWWTTP